MQRKTQFVPVAVEEVSLEGGSAGFLVVTVALRLVFVIPVSDNQLRIIKKIFRFYLLQLYHELP